MPDFESVRVSELPTGTLLDVREDYEWEAGHAAEALHIPMDEIPARLGELDPDEDLLVVCRTGGRSARVTAWLVAHGYSAMNVLGGMDAWVEAALPIVSENGQTPTVL